MKFPVKTTLNFQLNLDSGGDWSKFNLDSSSTNFESDITVDSEFIDSNETEKIKINDSEISADTFQIAEEESDKNLVKLNKDIDWTQIKVSDTVDSELKLLTLKRPKDIDSKTANLVLDRTGNSVELSKNEQKLREQLIKAKESGNLDQLLEKINSAPKNSPLKTTFNNLYDKASGLNAMQEASSI